MTITTFSLDFEGHRLRGDQWIVPHAGRHAILLHGAGNSDRSMFEPLREYLMGAGISSTAFDFIGHGQTGGKLLDSSLYTRVKQTLIVLRAMQINPDTALIAGQSMGAYIALHVAHQQHIPRLALIVPAAYAPEAFDVPFGPAFTAVLHREGCWQGSDAFMLLKSFTGHLLVVSADEDRVIPADLPPQLLAAARQAASTASLVLDGSGHNLATHFSTVPEDRERFHLAISRLCLQ